MIGSASTALNMLTGGYKPPVGFYFRAGLLEQMALAKASDAMGAGMSSESKFQEISGISMSLDGSISLGRLVKISCLCLCFISTLISCTFSESIQSSKRVPTKGLSDI
jgi:hypothetical protein